MGNVTTSATVDTLALSYTTGHAPLTIIGPDADGNTVIESSALSADDLATAIDIAGRTAITGSVSNWTRAFANCPALQTIPMMDTSGATNMTSVVNLCSSLRSIPAWNVANCTTFATAFTGCQSLESVLIVGSRYSMNFASGSLSSAALDAIYTNLGTAAGAQTITVTGNYGTTGDTPSIATSKGWTVTGS